MDSAKLQHFLAVAEHGHFGRAADALNLSQQALSKSIAALEQGLHVKLFERGQFGAVLTPYGEALRRRAKIVDAELRLGRAEIEALRGAKNGNVRVGVGLSFVGRIMPLTMLRMHEAHPDVQVSAMVESSAALYPMLLRGELDFVVSAPPMEVVADTDIRQERLFIDRDCVAVRADHPLAKRRKVLLADLQDYTWIMSAQMSGTWQRLCREFSAAGLAPPTRTLRTDSTGLGKELVLRSDAVILLSRENIYRELAQAELRVLDVSKIGEARQAYAAVRARSPLQPVAAELLEIVRQVCSELFGRPN